MTGPYLGKYRGTVFSNNDPEQRGRLQLKVPGVLGDETSSWAEPVLLFAGPSGAAMGAYVVPPEGAAVWVEFEQGDPSYPVWVGCRWGQQSEAPSDGKNGTTPNENLVLQSQQQHRIILSDASPSSDNGGIVLKTAAGAMIVVNDSGIYINNGKGASIKLEGPTVKINEEALSIT
ncbi:MAG: phage baseplate assembly protein V [Anaerolineae bacterium]|jgi:uncharacterized protein involved in type VI secretion and phage assembly|nr:phage baseplate assembly protein V [Anaerolineae bacterium]